MISLTDIALRRGPALLFEGVSFVLHAEQKMGLIGANGAGKTSLFKMILGELEPDRGTLELPRECRIAHLAQEVPGSPEPAIEYVLSGDADLRRIERELAAAERDEDYDRIAPLHEALDNIDGYTARARAERLMAGLGFAADERTQALSAFSGGWRIRANLARTLMSRADLLLLDEPTNHLDLDAIVWLSNWIRHFQGSLLLISHDREFLDETVNAIACLERGGIEVFTGNYSAFERQRAARLAQQQSQYERQQEEIRHMQDFVRRFRAKATKARQAQSRVKALERMEVIAPAHVDSPFNFTIPSATKLSNPLLVLSDATLGYSEPVLESVRLNLHPGDRIGLLGHNGAGKSTLIKSIKGELALLGGERVAGANLQIGYFSQHQVDELDLAASALTQLQRRDKRASTQQMRDFLGGFDFRGDKVDVDVATFSGGEKARLALAMIAFGRPNLLLMDEPTNHLDIEMRQALTVALQEFDGAIVLISHDRHLLMNTVDAFLLVEDGKVVEYDGDLDDYRERLLGTGPGAATKPEPKTKSKPPVRNDAFRENRQLKNRLKTLETRLERLQRKLAEVNERLADVTLYQDGASGDLQGLLREQLGLKEEISEAEETWLEMSEALETGT
ncbi:MAG: ABC-F family ATP-binding cassette domain-containing protein [Gammaproteobacteria bacterium]|jgi:ATP-binding cassette subfamily F protein 3